MTRNKYRKNCGPKLVERVKTLTTDLYNKIEEEVRDELKFPDDINELGAYLYELKTRASALYQKQLVTLPTKDLEDILYVHSRGFYKRAPETIENITRELATRQLFNVSTKEDDK